MIPQSHRSPVRDAGVSGNGGTSSSAALGCSVKASISRASKPVSVRSKSSACRSPNSAASSSISQSAHVTERFTISRKALTCASVQPSHGITGTSVIASLRAAFSLRWPSTTSPVDRASTGIEKPNSVMLATMRFTAPSFLRGFRS